MTVVPTIKKLEFGEVAVYKLREYCLHLYYTKDPMGDVITIVQKGQTGILIEQPNFTANYGELEGYLQNLNLQLAGIIAPYHPVGNFLPHIPRYSTKSAEYSALHGVGQTLSKKFAHKYGPDFDSTLLPINHYLPLDARVTIGGIELQLLPRGEAFDIAFPKIGVIYTHLLGHDMHSLILSHLDAKQTIARLQDFLAAGYPLIISSHHSPETLLDAQSKIAYLNTMLQLADKTDDQEEFIFSMEKAYPDHSGMHFLQMSAQHLFG